MVADDDFGIGTIRDFFHSVGTVPVWRVKFIKTVTDGAIALAGAYELIFSPGLLACWCPKLTGSGRSHRLNTSSLMVYCMIHHTLNDPLG